MSGAMELERESAERARMQARWDRRAKSARRTKIAAIVLLAVSVAFFVASFIAHWILNFNNDPMYGNPSAPFRYRFASFMQNVAYTAGFPLLCIAASIALLVYADRVQLDLEDAMEDTPAQRER